MPGPDLAVSRVVVRAENLLRVELTGAADSIDAADLTDALCETCWALTGDPSAPPSTVPTVRHVDAEDDTVASSTVFELVLDAPLSPAGAYLLGLTLAAHGAVGQSTDPTPVPFLAPLVGVLAAQRPGVQGADAAFPPAAGPTGDLVLDDRITALRKRLLDLPTFSRGTWTHRPDAGIGVQPKRTYSAAKLAAEADQIRATIAADPDVKRVLVSADASGLFSIAVIPTFSAAAIALPSVIVAGGSD